MDTMTGKRRRTGPGRMVAPLLVAALCACGAARDGAVTPEPAGLLPLGDGKVSTSPRVGYVFACQTVFRGAPAGSAPWISGTSWDPAAKPVVQGAADWPDAQLTITREGASRVVRTNNLPTHTTGTFPIARTDPAFAYDGNPNPIRAQEVLLRLTAAPQAAAAPGCVPQGLIGVTLSGAALYNALDVDGRDAAAHEVQDTCSGHPQAQGQYHYHSYSPCLGGDAGKRGQHSDLVGYALDGFGVYGPFGEGGARLTNADLDVCHGHTHSVAWDGAAATLYHYHVTAEYPYSIGCFRGTPATVARAARTRA